MKNGVFSGGTRLLNSALLGGLMVTLGVVTYPFIDALGLSLGIGNDGFVVSYAYLTLGLTVTGSLILFYCATRILTDWSYGEKSMNSLSSLSILGQVFARRQYSRLFLLSALVYGAFYALASGMIVFQPALDFSEVYHVGIPSLSIATCCGPFGETPEMVIYVTQHLGLLLVPVNLLLLFSISWLVGLNASFAAFALSFRTKNIGSSWIGGAGAFLGLFSSCPTCAGLAIIALFGGTGTLSAAFFLGPLQALFVGLSIPMLIGAPIMSARSLRNLEGQGCPRP